MLANKEGLEVDVHSYVFGVGGRNIHGVAYQPEQLTGEGEIGGFPVRCVNAAAQVESRSGYKLHANDYHDVKLLCERFKIPLPAEHKSLRRKLGWLRG